MAHRCLHGAQASEVRDRARDASFLFGASEVDADELPLLVGDESPSSEDDDGAWSSGADIFASSKQSLRNVFHQVSTIKPTLRNVACVLDGEGKRQ